MKTLQDYRKLNLKLIFNKLNIFPLKGKQATYIEIFDVQCIISNKALKNKAFIKILFRAQKYLQTHQRAQELY